MNLQTLTLSTLKPAPYNPRKISDDAMGRLEKSVKEWGIVDPLIVNKATGYTIIGGHQRFKVLQKQGVETADCVVLDLPPAKEKALNVALNNQKMAGEYEFSTLADILQEIDTGEFSVPDLTGFSDEDLAEIANWTPDPEEGKEETEPIPEPPEKAISQLGDLWELGEHRLLCGNFNDHANEGGDCETLIFDPEWNEGFEIITEHESKIVFGDGATVGNIFNQFGAPLWVFVWDCVSSWYTPNRPLRRMKLCAWYGDLAKYNFNGDHYGDPGDAKTVRNPRGSYDYKPDQRGKHLSDVYSNPITKLHSESLHSHSKPLEWVSMLIANCSSGGVFDPFCGSGTTIIASEKLNRKCYAIEIEPRYIDVAVKRWQNYTGKKGKNLTRPEVGID